MTLSSYGFNTFQPDIIETPSEYRLQNPETDQLLHINLDQFEFNFDFINENDIEENLGNPNASTVNATIPTEFSLVNESFGSLAVQEQNQKTQSNNDDSDDINFQENSFIDAIEYILSNDNNEDQEQNEAYECNQNKVLVSFESIPDETEIAKDGKQVENDNTLYSNVHECEVVEIEHQGIKEGSECSQVDFADPFQANNIVVPETQEAPSQEWHQIIPTSAQNQLVAGNVNTTVNGLVLPTNNSAIRENSNANTYNDNYHLALQLNEQDILLPNIITNSILLQPIREHNEQNVGSSRDLRNSVQIVINPSNQSIAENQTLEQSAERVRYTHNIINKRGEKVNAKQPKPYRCSVCFRYGQSPTHVRRHVKSMHSGIRDYTCEFCTATGRDYKGASRKDHFCKHLAKVHHMTKEQIKEHVKLHFSHLKDN